MTVSEMQVFRNVFVVVHLFLAHFVQIKFFVVEAHFDSHVWTAPIRTAFAALVFHRKLFKGLHKFVAET